MGNKVIALIPARGGSKRFPDKNIHEFNGKPLASWTIDFALNSDLFDCVYLNTDIDEILNSVSEKIKICPRPEELAGDNATLLDVIRYTCIEENLDKNDIVVLLPVTGPLRSMTDVNDGINLFSNTGKERTVISVNENPYPVGMLWTKDGSERLEPIFPEEYNATLQKQKHRTTYQFNDLFVIDTVEGFLKSGRNLFSAQPLAVVIPQERSMPIDYQYQFILAERLHQLEFENSRLTKEQ